MPDPSCNNTPTEPTDKVVDEIPLEQKRSCPYCSIVIETRPYWSHIATEHPTEYENSQGTWLPLYKDYSSAGMEITTILMVMSELFNASSKDLESFLMHSLFKEKIAAGTSEADAVAAVAQALGKKPAEVTTIVK